VGDVRTGYRRATTPGEVWACLTQLQAKTLIFDVEPLVAFWRTDQGVLADGIAAVLTAVAGAAPAAVVFATNSARRPPIPPAMAWATAGYLASAGKPLRVAAYRDLPRPGAVVGDQVATDGILAWRLGYTFVHYTPQLPVPLGPRLMRLLGRPLRPLLFRDA
jgi:predicted HAD superfamily phosphohydrolase YqeG